MLLWCFFLSMFQLFPSPKRFPSPLLFSVSHICPPPLILGRFFCHPLCPSNDFQMCLLLASLSPFPPLFLIQLFLILSPFSFLCSTMSKQLVLLFDSHTDVYVGLRSHFFFFISILSPHITHIAEKLWRKFLHRVYFFSCHERYSCTQMFLTKSQTHQASYQCSTQLWVLV